jgi:uncharacterized protein (DUF1501 family)
MLNRRDFLVRTLQGSSLLALSSMVPQFLARTALAAEAGKENVLVVIEMTGGNDGLNTVIPFADDLYHKARPTLRFTKDKVIKVSDEIGLHPAMTGFNPLLKEGQLAIVQGIGYPNPDRSHFESMDVWQSGDPKRKIGTGWIARSVSEFGDKGGNLPVIQIGPNRLPLALQGAPGGVVSIADSKAYRLDLGKGDPADQKNRRKLMEDLSKPSGPENAEDLLQFVQRRQVQTLSTLDRLQELLKDDKKPAADPDPTTDPQQAQAAFSGLGQKMGLISKIIAKNFGTRVFYAAIDGFDTHSGQAETQQALLAEVAGAINLLFTNLKATGDDKRVIAITFSEFGRRVHENGSKGTDHGSGSCLFVAGPKVKGGLVGAHPSLKDLDDGDLRYHTDFRKLYATLLDDWLGCNSRLVLGEKFDHMELIKAKY